MFDAFTADALLGALLIFSLRIVDVSLGTLRIGMLVRGKRRIAGVLSFSESPIWLLAAAKVLSTLDSPLQFIAYAGGYASGTMLGANIKRWLAVGKVVLRIIVPVSAPDVQEALRKAGFYVTTVNASGRDGEVRVMVQRHCPQAHETGVPCHRGGVSQGVRDRGRSDHRPASGHRDPAGGAGLPAAADDAKIGGHAFAPASRLF